MITEPHSFAELQQRIHFALREQHPDWIEPNGDSSLCDAYESRFAELLRMFEETSDREVA